MEECSLEEDWQFEELIAADPSPVEEDVDEAVLQRALLAANRGLPSTPPATPLHPRTPYQTAKAKSLAASGSESSVRHSSRLQPFPPPKPLRNSEHYPAADLNPVPSPAARVDPYQETSLVTMQTTVPQQGVLTKPKPKAQIRVPVKDSAKPSGPVGKKVLLHFSSKLEEMRAAAMQEVLSSGKGLDKGGTHSECAGGLWGSYSGIFLYPRPQACYHPRRRWPGDIRDSRFGGGGGDGLSFLLPGFQRTGDIRFRLVALRAPGLLQVLGPGQRESLHRHTLGHCWLSEVTAAFSAVQLRSSLRTCFTRCFASLLGFGIAASGGVHCPCSADVKPCPVIQCWCLTVRRLCKDRASALRARFPSVIACDGSPRVLGLPLGLPVFHRSQCNLPGLNSSLPAPVCQVEPISRDATFVIGPAQSSSRGGVCSSLICASADVAGSQADAQDASGHLLNCAPSRQDGRSFDSAGKPDPWLCIWCWFAAQWGIFIRTGLLFILLSTLHLFAWTCHIRKGHGHRNRLSLCTRKCLRGAPIIWALFVVAHLIPVACAGRTVETEEGQQDRSTASLTSHCPASSARDGPCPVPTDRPPEQSMLEVAVRDMPPFDDFKFLICLYEFQLPATYTCAWASEAQQEDEFIVLILEEQVGQAGSKIVVPVSPQPRSHAVAVIVSEVWNLALLQCPVLIQVYAGPFYSFVEYFVGGVTEQDVRLSIGDVWPPGGKVYVGESLAPLPDDEIFQPSPGLLIRVSPPSLIPGIPVPLSRRLASPREWLHDVGIHGFPTTRNSAGKICVLGAWSDQQVCRVDRTTTAGDLRTKVLEHCGLWCHLLRPEQACIRLCHEGHSHTVFHRHRPSCT